MGNWWVIGLFDKVLTLNKVWGNSGGIMGGILLILGGGSKWGVTRDLSSSSGEKTLTRIGNDLPRQPIQVPSVNYVCLLTRHKEAKNGAESERRGGDVPVASHHLPIIILSAILCQSNNQQRPDFDFDFDFHLRFHRGLEAKNLATWTYWTYSRLLLCT